MKKWTGAILALMLLVSAISIGCNSTSGPDTDYSDTEAQTDLADDAHSKQADPNYDVVFAQDKVNRIDIVIDAEHWQAMIDDMTENYGKFGKNMLLDKKGEQAGGFPGDRNSSGNYSDDEAGQGGKALIYGADNPIWSECTIVFNDTTWEHVGIRFKGFSSLKSSWYEGTWKLPLRLDFDQFEANYPETNDQRFYGFKKLSLSSGWSDDSLIRDKVVADIFREAGVPSPATAFYELYVNYGEGPVYFGLYAMVEIPDEPMLDTQFGDDEGNLYKPSGTCASFRDSRFNASSLQKQSNEDEADWSDITALFEALHAATRTTDPAAWRSGLESVFDVEGFLRWLAANTVMQNWDTYGRLAHNYYLYNDPADGLLHWIPRDNNEALNSRHATLSLSLSEVNEQWPLINYLIGDAHYHEMYLSFMSEFAIGIFSVDYVEARCQEAHDLIEPYVIGETKDPTFLSRPQDFHKALAAIFTHIENRRATALAFLSEQGFEPSDIVISEIHYNPPSDQGSVYEFVELCNTGTSSIDISGYAFTDGIEFTFPHGTSIDSGEYIIVAADAYIYAGLNCQVFQWESGNLSNKGETVQLSDDDGIQIDYVIYGDAYPWTENADGDGPSLEVIDLNSANALPANWEASSSTGGTPGLSNS